MGNTILNSFYGGFGHIFSKGHTDQNTLKPTLKTSV